MTLCICQNPQNFTPQSEHKCKEDEEEKEEEKKRRKRKRRRKRRRENREAVAEGKGVRRKSFRK